jgi:SAM-dependent methyltransferase
MPVTNPPRRKLPACHKPGRWLSTSLGDGVVEQSAQVALYFDRISADYRARYAAQNPFHNFFFRQRLEAAIDGIAFDDKSVLDIGAGTGALYDALKCLFPNVDYFGCDISGRMLAQSNIPADRAFVGRVHEIALLRKQFDFIFSLGVTTYQDPAELAKTWRFIGDRLAPGGAAIISFTNRDSVDHVIRGMMKFTKPIARRGVFGQSFAIHSYRMREVEAMASAAGLRVTRSAYLNQTFCPFNSIFPKPSVAVAKLIERYAPEIAVPVLSSDFLVFAEREPG